MGNRTGVEAREKSIRLFFVHDGQEYRETIRVDGKPIAPTPANLKFAARLAREIRVKIEAGNFSLSEYFPASPRATVGRGLTVGSQLDGWLATMVIEDSTRRGYESCISLWKEALGADKPLRQLVHSDIKRALAKWADKSGKTLNNRVAVLHSALQLSVLDKVLAANPADSIPAAAWQKPPVDPFTQVEVDAILVALHALHAPQIRSMVEFWMFTGMRTSEIFALKWDNVDLAKGTALVCESRIDGVEKRRTKTSVARTVHLNSRALAALRAQRACTQVQGGAVFHDPRSGSAWGGAATFQRVFWVPALNLAGVRQRRPYNCRHTYASLMLMAGMRAPFCAKQLGHSVEVFHTTYARWIDGDADAGEMARLELKISGGG